MAGQTFPFMDGSPEAEVCGIAMEKLVLPNGIEIKDAELTLNNLVGTEKEFYLNEANITNTDKYVMVVYHSDGRFIQLDDNETIDSVCDILTEYNVIQIELRGPIDDQPGNLNLNVQVRNQTH
uniref:FERM domain-containing protein n=1 Tax=Arion vulgaris TaxID=1028688 RepID=A0A0B7AVD5_9EUPU